MWPPNDNLVVGLRKRDGSTSNTVRANGWARYSEDWSTFFLLSPFRSTLQSMCSFESTQYNLPLIRSGRKREKPRV